MGPCFPLWLLSAITLQFVQPFEPFHLIVGSEDWMLMFCVRAGNPLKTVKIPCLKIADCYL